jgi:hypothetical protein
VSIVRSDPQTCIYVQIEIKEIKGSEYLKFVGDRP